MAGDDLRDPGSGGLLFALADVVEARAAVLAEVETLTCGKPWQASMTTVREPVGVTAQVRSATPGRDWWWTSGCATTCWATSSRGSRPCAWATA